MFGEQISTSVSEILAERDIRLVCDTIPRDVDRHGLQLADGGRLSADRVIAAPSLVGQPVPGVPADAQGFVHTVAGGRVEELADVYAAGDMTSFPVKQGGLAAQQADVIAADIARRAGATPATPPPAAVLRAQLFGAPEPLFLEAALDERGQPIEGRSQLHSEAPWWPRGTLFGRHLTPWIAQQALTAG